MKVLGTKLHDDAKNAVMEALRPFQDKLSAEEILALMAKVVGMLVALQDQRKYTPQQIMSMVSANIESGNQDMVDQLMKSQGGVQ